METTNRIGTLYELLTRKKEEEERRRRSYEEWRRKNLSNCYAERLDYSICQIHDVEIGPDVLSVLKPGDKVATEFNVEDIDFIDPCFVKKKIDKETYYVEGYVPLYSEHCRYKHECGDFVIMRLPLYIRGQVKASSKFVVVKYMGNGDAEIAEASDYDYYLAVIFYDYLEGVEGGTWHNVCEWNSYRIHILELSTCCFDDYYPSAYIVAMLIKRGESKVLRRRGQILRGRDFCDGVSSDNRGLLS
ncbi:MAG: hypothetical protein ACO2PM_01545 [Pyrobaculum sp.]|jgi:hypothetical protein